MQPHVQQAFDDYPPGIRRRLLQLRKLIFATAARDPAIGPLTETLKWGEPAYLTEQSKSGSTLRIGWKASDPDRFAMYFNCQTTIVDSLRTLHPELVFEGNRALLFDRAAALPEAAVRRCIEHALTYHAAKRKRRRA